MSAKRLLKESRGGNDENDRNFGKPFTMVAQKKTCSWLVTGQLTKPHSERPLKENSLSGMPCVVLLGQDKTETEVSICAHHVHFFALV